MKKLFSILPVLFLCLFFISPATASTIPISIDGQVLKTDTAPEIKNNRVFVPMRTIMEALGSEVHWDAATNTAAATKGTSSVSVSIGKTQGQANGQTVTLDYPPYSSNNRTMVPLRFISESLGADVQWTGGKVIVNTGKNTNTEGNTNDSASGNASITPQKPAISYHNIAQTKSFNFTIDGKTPDFAKQCFFYIWQFQKDAGEQEYLMVPLEPYVKALTPASKFGTFIDLDKGEAKTWNYFETPTDVYRWNKDSAPLSKYGKDIGNSKWIIEGTDGQWYVDAKYVAENLGAAYTFDPVSKTVTVKSKTYLIQNNEIKDHYIVNSPDDVYDILQPIVFSYSEPGIRIEKYFYPSYLQGLNPEFGTLEDGFGTAGNENYRIGKAVFGYGNEVLSDYGAWQSDEDKSAYKFWVDLDVYGDDSESMLSLVNKKAQEIVASTIKPGMSDREKIQTLHDWVVQNTEYDKVTSSLHATEGGYTPKNQQEEKDFKGSYTAYGPFFTGKATCSGYTIALNTLLYNTGYEIASASSYTSDGTPHGWTIVKLNGQEYHIDATWNDAENTNKYFMCSAEDMAVTHKYKGDKSVFVKK